MNFYVLYCGEKSRFLVGDSVFNQITPPEDKKQALSLMAHRNLLVHQLAARGLYGSKISISICRELKNDENKFKSIALAMRLYEFLDKYSSICYSTIEGYNSLIQDINETVVKLNNCSTKGESKRIDIVTEAINKETEKLIELSSSSNQEIKKEDISSFLFNVMQPMDSYNKELSPSKLPPSELSRRLYEIKNSPQKTLLTSAENKLSTFIKKQNDILNNFFTVEQELSESGQEFDKGVNELNKSFTQLLFNFKTTLETLGNIRDFKGLCESHFTNEKSKLRTQPNKINIKNLASKKKLVFDELLKKDDIENFGINKKTTEKSSSILNGKENIENSSKSEKIDNQKMPSSKRKPCGNEHVGKSPFNFHNSSSTKNNLHGENNNFNLIVNNNTKNDKTTDEKSIIKSFGNLKINHKKNQNDFLGDNIFNFHNTTTGNNKSQAKGNNMGSLIPDNNNNFSLSFDN